MTDSDERDMQMLPRATEPLLWTGKNGKKTRIPKGCAIPPWCIEGRFERDE